MQFKEQIVSDEYRVRGGFLAAAPLLPVYRLSPDEIDEILRRLPDHLEIPMMAYNANDPTLREYLEHLEKNT